MSDPLSVIASVVALLDTGTKCAKHLRRLIHDIRHADDELIALSNEINDLRVVLMEVEHVSQNPSIRPQPQLIDALSTQLSRAKIKLTKLDSLTRSLSQVGASGALKINKFAWLKKKATAKRLQEDLKDVRQKICALLSITTAVGSSRIELNLESLQALYVQHHNSLLTHLGQASTDQQAQRLSLEQLIQQSFLYLRDELTAHRGEMDTRFGQLSAHTQETNSRLSQVSGQTLVNHTSVNKVMDSLTNKDIDTRIIHQPQANTSTPQLPHLYTVSIQRRWKCRVDCPCICHVRRIYQSPAFLNRFLGRLFIGYSGQPILRSCNDSICQRHSLSSVDIVYFFPLWFLSRVIYLIAELSCTGSLSFGLTVQRVLSITRPEYSVLQMISSKDSQGFRTAIESKYISPNDLFGIINYTALYWAVRHLNFDAIAILLSAGANTNFISALNNSPLQNAWEIILTKRGTPEEIQQLERFFALSKAEEILELSDLHKVVLGLQHVDLQVALNKSFYKLQINSHDYRGRTPLHWAVEMGDAAAVQVLIQCGAEVNNTDRYSRTPLHLSARIFRYTSSNRSTRNAQYKITQSLLVAGADAQAKDKVGDQVLHLACASWVSLDFVRLLIANNAPLNERNNHGVSPLGCAAIGFSTSVHNLSSRNQAEVGSFLIENGAAVNVCDNDGDPPLFQALIDRVSSFIEMILSRGADYTITNNAGLTVLHITAMFSDTKCARFLEQANLRGVNPEAKDKKGKTARQYLEERVAPPEGFIAAFEKLLESVQKANAGPIVVETPDEAEEIEEVIEEDTGEEFIEALETQEVT